MEIWYLYIWAFVIFGLSAFHLYKANLGCAGFLFLLLCQLSLLLPSFQHIHTRLIGLECALAIYTQGFLTFLLIISAMLESFFKSFKYRSVSVIMILIIPIAAWILFLSLF